MVEETGFDWFLVQDVDIWLLASMLNCFFTAMSHFSCSNFSVADDTTQLFTHLLGNTEPETTLQYTMLSLLRYFAFLTHWKMSIR